MTDQPAAAALLQAADEPTHESQIIVVSSEQCAVCSVQYTLSSVQKTACNGSVEMHYALIIVPERLGEGPALAPSRVE